MKKLRDRLELAMPRMQILTEGHLESFSQITHKPEVKIYEWDYMKSLKGVKMEGRTIEHRDSGDGWAWINTPLRHLTRDTILCWRLRILKMGSPVAGQPLLIGIASTEPSFLPKRERLYALNACTGVFQNPE